MCVKSSHLIINLACLDLQFILYFRIEHWCNQNKNVGLPNPGIDPIKLTGIT